MLDFITVNTHSSIQLKAEKVIYVDPFEITEEVHDADLILFTHDHFDHFSPEAFRKLAKEETVYVAPESMKEKVLAEGIAEDKLVCVIPGDQTVIEGIPVEAKAAYNIGKPFHPKESAWVGYVLEVKGMRVYVAGDTDATEEAKAVKCDITLLPVGGTYTMSAKEAAGLADTICPEYAIPTHYGSVAGKASDGLDFMKSLTKLVQVIFKL